MVGCFVPSELLPFTITYSVSHLTITSHHITINQQHANYTTTNAAYLSVVITDTTQRGRST